MSSESWSRASSVSRRMRVDRDAHRGAVDGGVDHAVEEHGAVDRRCCQGITDPAGALQRLGEARKLGQIARAQAAAGEALQRRQELARAGVEALDIAAEPEQIVGGAAAQRRLCRAPRARTRARRTRGTGGSVS